MNAIGQPLLLLLALAGSVIAADNPFDPKMQEFVKRFQGHGALGDGSKAPSPQESLRHFKLADGLVMDLVASEPVIRQPLNLHFDERGRLWVVQYLQYPFPAGLKVVKYDEYLRAIFDQVPPPPPNHFKGADKITILEDTDGDGVFDRAKDFLSDLNIARSVVTGRGGVWVLNPPYLLFYPDKNRDDIPDGPPEVVLSGFGIEDTHSGANSLAWGPDGWLYGAHGSTCTADVKGVKFLGQAIWRYQPATREFEVFAEGGGNTFSLEFDSKGRVFSGSNFGATRGLHYPQGSAFVKNWGKHGPLMNPYSFGWFEHMAHKGYPPRFPQTMIIYEGGALPKYEGQLIAGMALTSRVQASALGRDTSTFQTVDTDVLASNDDKFFRPVDTKAGPDGAIYLADWCDSRLSHLDPRDTWDKESGRIYRLKAPGAKPSKPFDLAALSSGELIKLLSHPNKWQRQMALRIFWDRRDKSVIPALKKLAAGNTGQLALEAFWAVNACGGFDEAYALQTLTHGDEFVRYWTVRLLGDSKNVSPQIQSALLRQARTEPAAEVRAQLASTLKRLPGKAALPILHELLLRDEDVADKHIPLLLWWALESKTAGDREQVLALLQDSTLWSAPIFSRHIAWRLGKRYAAERSAENLETCARLFSLAPTPRDVDELVRGMEEGLQGDPVTAVPAGLQKLVADIWAARQPTPTLTSFALRLGHAPATEAALQRIADSKASETERKKLLNLLAERRIAGALPVFLELLRREKSDGLRLELVNGLQRFGDDSIARVLIELYPAMSVKLRAAAQGVLCSRPAWARLLLENVDSGTLRKEQISAANLLAIQGFKDSVSDALIIKHWGRLTRSSEEKEAQIAKVRQLLAGGRGDPKQGREIFRLACATCHTLNGEGGKIGPELTGYERDNLDFILPAIVDPSLAIREEYTAFNLTTRDGQSLTGLLLENNPRAVTLMDLSGNRLVLSRQDIQTLQASQISLMPEGLLETLTEQQIRDLFSYLQAGGR